MYVSKIKKPFSLLLNGQIVAEEEIEHLESHIPSARFRNV